MVKIRLRRIGTKARPFYRVVVTPSTAARNGRFVETLGTYDPIRKPTHIEINEDRALHWLMNGAQPTETTAFLLNKIGVLDRFFEQRPAAKKQYSFLDKRTDAMSVESVISQPAAKKDAPVAEPVSEAAPEAPAAEAAAEQAPVAEAPAEEAPVDEAPAEEAAPAAETPAEEPEAAVEAPAEEAEAGEKTE